MPGDYPCRDAVASIANRTLACTGDEQLADDRAEAFWEEYRCIDVDTDHGPVEVYLHCSAAIGAASCDTVEKMGGDLGGWLALSSSCGLVIQHADGAPL